jgi:hypothetical protein
VWKLPKTGEKYKITFKKKFIGLFPAPIFSSNDNKVASYLLSLLPIDRYKLGAVRGNFL